MKNWQVLEFLPVFDMETTPRASCFSLRPAASSSPKHDS